MMFSNLAKPKSKIPQVVKSKLQNLRHVIVYKSLFFISSPTKAIAHIAKN